MALKDDLESFTPLDREFAKRSTVLWDIVASYYRKQLNAVNALADDLYKFASEEVKGNRKWKCDRYGWSEKPFPRGGRLPKGFSEFPDDIDFRHHITMQMKSKGEKTGFRFVVYADTDGFGWWGDQWGNSKDEVLFDFSFYKKCGKSIKMPPKVDGDFEILFPDSDNVSTYDRDEKSIHVWCFADDSFTKEKLIAVHQMVKKSVFAETIKEVRRRRLL